MYIHIMKNIEEEEEEIEINIIAEWIKENRPT